MGQTSSHDTITGKQAAHIGGGVGRVGSLQHLLTRSERVVLRDTYKHLKTRPTKDTMDHIDLQGFLGHLRLPTSLEHAGILLFKAFSHAGAYPDCHLASPPVPLDWSAFLTAYIVLSGKMDQQEPDNEAFDALLFESLAIVPRSTLSPPEQQQQEELEQQIEQQEEEQAHHHVTSDQGLSLADLGIRFDDEDNDANEAALDPVTTTLTMSTDKSDTPLVILLLSDLTHLLRLALWIGVTAIAGENDKNDKNDEIDANITTTATHLAHVIARMDPTVEEGKVTMDAFLKWKRRNAPNFFDAIQSFIYSRFATTDDLVQPSSRPAVPDVSDILTDVQCVMLAWAMPQIPPNQPKTSNTPTPSTSTSISAASSNAPQHRRTASMPVPTSSSSSNSILSTSTSFRSSPMGVAADHLVVQRWPRLYAGDKDGFAMNRFENRVFKYAGPTLLVLQGAFAPAQACVAHQLGDDGDHDKQLADLVLAVLIPEGWKQGRHFWGTAACRVVELQPHFELYRPTQRNDQYACFLRELGIAIGGLSPQAKPSPTRNMLFLDNSLQKGKYNQEAYPSLATFDRSDQWHDIILDFDLVGLEVFGLGADAQRLLDNQKRAWQFDANDATKRAGLQLRNDDGGVDKEILRMAGLIDHYGATEQNQDRHQKHQSQRQDTKL
ncbi:hypothetical protein BC940DRAFT_367166 [Gongronella butleri]|nr:hypothetical protein BC940DRAFT_367166 [Gongronella butleri]